MQLPFFYEESISQGSHILNSETSKHVVQVLRMQIGEKILLTNGKGKLVTAEITNNHKKSCEVAILDSQDIPPVSGRKVGVAVSPLKNNSRFEWFLEKATELGITDIFPIITSRTERQHFRFERLNTICISAMLQSRQAWLPVLHQPININELIVSDKTYGHLFIAHCIDEDSKVELSQSLNNNITDGLILIGPEGDFTPAEIDLALQNKFNPVSLGPTRLRTETAALVATTILRLL